MHTILMADIIDSRTKESLAAARQFKKMVSVINKTWKQYIVSPLTITLGDEFQAILENPQHGVELIFAIEELIIKQGIDFKLRYVLHVGKIDTRLNHKIAHGMMGQGLTDARNYLNRMKQEDARFFLKTQKKERQETVINDAFSVYQNIIDNWKAKDMKVVGAFLDYDDYKLVASKIGKDISSTWRRKKSLSINEYGHMKNVILYLVSK